MLEKCLWLSAETIEYWMTWVISMLLSIYNIMSQTSNQVFHNPALNLLLFMTCLNPSKMYNW